MMVFADVMRQAVRPPQDRTALSDWLVFLSVVSLGVAVAAFSLAVAAFISSVAVLLGGWILCGACILGGGLLLGLSFAAGALAGGAALCTLVLKSTFSILSWIAPSLHARMLQKYKGTLMLLGWCSSGAPPASASLAVPNHQAKPSVRKQVHHSPSRAKETQPCGHGPWTDSVAQPLFEEEDSTLPLNAHFLARNLPEHTSTARTAGEQATDGPASHVHEGVAQPPSPDCHKPCPSKQERDVQHQPRTCPASLTADQLATLPSGPKHGPPSGDFASDVTTTSQVSSKSRKAARYKANKQKQKQQVPREAEQHV
ncbi:hypothetical protein DUNSADRAFT_11305 [Dunaliella salina]|uniref:Uncharacterized protein n=1 Tax=Dunaliella salina TaxID=3046 RepID=A0ABQ7GDT5_DUNSA|nr:hypothetical protein DUNSADRAFT_11305 [Dunaliella salina]|eukprot:KAF5832723.1 hypothetical protein DUNSADRAFT_11305 [Dunaliella salina]